MDDHNCDCVLIAAAEEVAEFHCDGVSESLGKQTLRHWRGWVDGVLRVQEAFDSGGVGCAACDSKHCAVPRTSS